MSEEILPRKSLFLIFRRDLLRRNRIYRVLTVTTFVLLGVFTGQLFVLMGFLGGPEAGTVGVAGFTVVVLIVYLIVWGYMLCALGCTDAYGSGKNDIEEVCRSM